MDSGASLGQSAEQPFVARQPPTLDDDQVTIAYIASGKRSAVPVHAPTDKDGQELLTLLRSRENWVEVPEARARVQEVCRCTIMKLGIDKTALQKIAESGAVQLTISTEQSGAQAFPWEFTLGSATDWLRDLDGGSFPQFTLIRRLNVKGGIPPRAPERVLVVESAPGGLDIYDFESERRLVTSSLDLGEPAPLENPSEQELAAQLLQHVPAVVHLAGVDSEQGAAILGVPVSASPGMYLKNNGLPQVVDYQRLGDLLGEARPALVAFNFWNSSAGAAQAVLRGAGAAIGFQGDIDDSLAELFFASFYGEWKRSEWNMLRAFRAAWRRLLPQVRRLRGTGIVLWTRHDVLEVKPISTLRREVIVDPDQTTNVDECFEITCVPPEYLNYALLHNNADLYSRFTVKRQRPGAYYGITAEVRLSVGPDAAVYRRSFSLTDRSPLESIHDEARVSLTSELIRKLDESMFGTISASVRWGKHVLYEDTRRVEFQPIDEWKNDKRNKRWLPSFVFPRDPVIRGIVDSAQRYLIALRDDSSAGFDGYQSCLANGTLAARCAGVDAQVQALWWTLLYDYSLTYINPPPSFSLYAQRLRTPSEIVEGKRGTCIDLALLLAACLEYVEIYPVIFLLSDHAFPGYWRSETSYRTNMAADGLLADGAKSQVRIDDTCGGAPWMLDSSAFNKLSVLVRDGCIIPLETVSLTSRAGFWDAVDEGTQNLRSKREFQALFDIRSARARVKPMPIWSKKT